MLQTSLPQITPSQRGKEGADVPFVLMNGLVARTNSESLEQNILRLSNLYHRDL